MILQGQFKDSNTQGLSYVSGSESGVTDGDGTFSYEQGETVTFSVGGVTLGVGNGKPIMTPLDLVSGGTIETDAVVNLTRFLMLLDEDEDPANGITIGSAVATAASGWSSVDFSSASFDTDIASIVTDVGTAYSSTPSLVAANVAANHLKYTYACAASGVYAGSFTGDLSGTALVWVDSILYDPTQLGTFDPVQGAAYGAFYNASSPNGFWTNVAGGLSFEQNNTVAIGSSNAFLQLSGNLENFNAVNSGGWTYGAQSGTYSIARVAGASDAVYRVTGYYTLSGGSLADSLGGLALDVASDSSVSGKLALSDGTTVDISGSLTGTTISVSGSGYSFTIALDADGSDASNDDQIGEMPGGDRDSQFL